MAARPDVQVVLKYCEVIDEFIKVRVFADDEVSQIPGAAQINNRRAYQKIVVQSCVLDYQETVKPLFAKFNRIYKPEALEDVLYQICVEVNPHLEIHQVSLPLSEDGKVPQDDQERLRSRLQSKAIGIERELMGRVIGQNEAVAAVSKAVKKAAVGLRDPKKPIGVYLLVGSTGTGKTELAKVVASHLFGSTANLVRVDCSEFALPHEYAKLIGAPPGYIGHNEGGYLTEAVKTKKQCVVLFDEIEKAHNKIHNLLLQLMDEGTLTDGKGNTVKFDSALVLLTSNIGVHEIEDLRNRCGFGGAKKTVLTRDEATDAIQRSMKDTFAPEFLNRLDDVIMFNSLTEMDCRRIARLQLDEVAGYLKSSGVHLSFSPKVEQHIAHLGYSPEYGARELRRIIKSQIENPLAEMLLAGRFASNSGVSITVRRGRFHFAPGGAAATSEALVPTSAST